MIKNAAYLHCGSGVAGDMLLAAFIDSGVQLKVFEARLKRQLRFRDFGIRSFVTKQYHFPARRFEVTGDRSFTSPFEIRRIIARSSLSTETKRRSLAALDYLIQAESRVHGVPGGKVHFHELNSIDTLIDITGTCLMLELVGIDAAYASPVNIGNPAPATLAIAKERHVPVYSSGSMYELATPTGMSLLAAIVTSFEGTPPMIVQKTGIGAGARVIEGHPNVLKVLIGQGEGKSGGRYGRDMVCVLVTNIDDMDPRIYPHVIERLFAAGAKDAWLTQILMKKGRPAVQLSVISDQDHELAMADTIFKETTTLGIRRHTVPRFVLKRTENKDSKTAHLPDGTCRKKSEFEVVRKKAILRKIPLTHLLV